MAKSYNFLRKIFFLSITVCYIIPKISECKGQILYLTIVKYLRDNYQVYTRQLSSI